MFRLNFERNARISCFRLQNETLFRCLSSKRTFRQFPHEPIRMITILMTIEHDAEAQGRLVAEFSAWRISGNCVRPSFLNASA